MMSRSVQQNKTILMADDDPEDCLLVQDALREADRECDLRIVRNGEELFDYLHRAEGHEGNPDAPWPDLILLDLKMPRKDGRETICELKASPRYRHIPVVALTTSTASDDVEFSYNAGVNAYVPKPTSFREWVRILGVLGRHWFDVVELPPKTHRGEKNGGKKT
jgi:CheY-like chemotaxis protein